MAAPSTGRLCEAGSTGPEDDPEDGGTGVSVTLRASLQRNPPAIIAAIVTSSSSRRKTPSDSEWAEISARAVRRLPRSVNAKPSTANERTHIAGTSFCRNKISSRMKAGGAERNAQSAITTIAAADTPQLWRRRRFLGNRSRRLREKQESRLMAFILHLFVL